ncbi:hypothetical protein BH23GEM9_BH23GEM9_03670 [soil metagenome]
MIGGLVVAHLPNQGPVGKANVAVEALGAGEPIDARPTQRYRITVELSRAIGTDDNTVARAVSELWQADAPHAIPNPFLGLGGDELELDPPLRELNARLLEIGRSLPGLTVKSEGEASLATMSVVFTRSRITTSLTQIRVAEIDARELVLPDGFSRAAR